MANDQEPLIRNPQSGRYLSKLESQAVRAHLAVQQHGMTPDEQNFIAMEDTLGRDSKAVQDIITELVHLVRSHSGSVSDLKKAAGLVQQIATTAKANVILTVGERKRVEAFIKDLLQFIAQKTSLKTRVASSLKNVAKASLPNVDKARTGLSDKLSESSSFLFRLAGKALAVDRKHQSDMEKDMLEAKDNILQKLLRSNQTKLNASNSPAFSGPMDFEDDVPAPHPARAKAKAKAPKKAPEAETAAGQDEMLEVEKAILHQVTVTNQLLRTGGELSVQDRQAKERAADSLHPVTASGKIVRDKSQPKESGSLLGMLGPLVGMLGVGLTGLIRSAGGTLVSLFESVAARVLGTLGPLATRTLGGGIGMLAGGLTGAGLGHLTPADARVPDESTEAQDGAIGAVLASPLPLPAKVAVVTALSQSGDTPNLFTPESRAKWRAGVQSRQDDIDKKSGMPGLPPVPSRILGESEERYAKRSEKEMASFQARKDKVNAGRDINLPAEPKKSPVPLDWNRLPESMPGLPGSPIRDKRIKTVLSAGPRFVVVQNEDGTTDRREGDHNWRDNNPGNIRYTPLAKSYGAIGADEGYSVFPTMAVGQAAQKRLLQSSLYRSKKVSAVIEKWAPPTENDTKAYQDAVGKGDKRISDLSPAEFDEVVSAMQKHEGQLSGRVIPMVSADRSADAIATLTTATAAGRSGRGNVTVVAPSVAAASGGGQGPTIVPQPVTVENTDPTVRALRSVNSM